MLSQRGEKFNCQNSHEVHMTQMIVLELLLSVSAGRVFNNL